MLNWNSNREIERGPQDGRPYVPSEGGSAENLQKQMRVAEHRQMGEVNLGGRLSLRGLHSVYRIVGHWRGSGAVSSYMK